MYLDCLEYRRVSLNSWHSGSHMDLSGSFLVQAAGAFDDEKRTLPDDSCGNRGGAIRGIPNGKPPAPITRGILKVSCDRGWRNGSSVWSAKGDDGTCMDVIPPGGES